MMMIDMDGGVHRADESVATPEESVPVLEFEQNQEQAFEAPAALEPTAFENSFEESENIQFDQDSSFSIGGDTGALDLSSETPQTEINNNETTNLETDINPDFSSFDGEAYSVEDTQVAGEQQAQSMTSAFAEVTAFANQDIEIESLLFDLTISGIDHSESASRIQEVLQEPKLFLDFKNLRPKNGVVKIPNLSAARASYIVTKLQALPVQMSWKQKRFGFESEEQINEENNRVE